MNESTAKVLAECRTMLKDSPAEGDESEAQRLAELGTAGERIRVALILRMGEAGTVEEALRDFRECREAHERALRRRRGFRAL